MSTEKPHNQELYETTREELLAAQRKNAEKFDESVLTLAVALLGVSLAFIKDIVSLDSARATWTLIASWVSLSLSIVLCVSGMLYGIRISKILLEAAKRYYIDDEEDAWEISRSCSKKLDRINSWVGLLFLVGVLLTVFFVSFNTWSGFNDNEQQRLHNENSGDKRLSEEKAVEKEASDVKWTIQEESE
ncbi:MAG: hypothetical protein AAGH76_08960 [Pseudomonadota bacterium]